MIHEILAHHRALESKWHAKKIKLHQRLALRLFQEDVKQVLDWLEKHGEVFLRKNLRANFRNSSGQVKYDINFKDFYILYGKKKKIQVKISFSSLENRLLPVALVTGCLVYATTAIIFFMELV